MQIKNKKYALILILLLGALLRMPGGLWGYHLLDSQTISLHPDESTQVAIAQAFLNNTPYFETGHPKGFAMQMAISNLFLDRLLHLLPVDLLQIFPRYLFGGIGRIVSIINGTITLLLIYFFTKEFFKNEKAAILTTLFLSLAGLHVTNSHFATPDISVVLWVYAALYFSLLFINKEKLLFLLLASISTGFAIGIKAIFVTAIPLLYFTLKSKDKIFVLLLVTSGVIAGFTVINGFTYTPIDAKIFVEMIWEDNMSTNLQKPDILNPLIYFLEMIPGVGLPVFLLGLYGTINAVRNAKFEITKLYEENQSIKYIFHSYWNRHEYIIIILPIVFHFIAISTLDVSWSRHILLEVPLITMVAAVTFTKIKFKPTLLLLLIIIYQLISVVSVEYYYIVDTRRTAGDWISENIDKKETIAIGYYVFLPLEYNTLDISDETPLHNLNLDVLESTNYLVLHEGHYERYIRNELNPLGQPDPNHVHHGSPTTAKFIQSLFEGGQSYKLIKKVEVRHVVLELILYKKLFGTYPTLIGDVLVYEKMG